MFSPEVLGIHVQRSTWYARGGNQKKVQELKITLWRWSPLNKQKLRNRVEWIDKEGLNLQTQSRIRQKECKDQIYKLAKLFSNRSVSVICFVLSLHLCPTSNSFMNWLDLKTLKKLIEQLLQNSLLLLLSEQS